jgi:hypothetical protein
MTAHDDRTPASGELAVLRGERLLTLVVVW